MSLEDAMAVTLTAGKYQGQTLEEVTLSISGWSYVEAMLHAYLDEFKTCDDEFKICDEETARAIYAITSHFRTYMARVSTYPQLFEACVEPVRNWLLT